jgi:hypothetical protein
MIVRTIIYQYDNAKGKLTTEYNFYKHKAFTSSYDSAVTDFWIYLNKSNQTYEVCYSNVDLIVYYNTDIDKCVKFLDLLLSKLKSIRNRMFDKIIDLQDIAKQIEGAK